LRSRAVCQLLRRGFEGKLGSLGSLGLSEDAGLGLRRRLNVREAEDGLVKVFGRVAERGSVNALRLVLRGLEVYTFVSRVGKGGRALEAVLPATRDRLE
jgi:hypothetical protein